MNPRLIGKTKHFFPFKQLYYRVLHSNSLNEAQYLLSSTLRMNSFIPWVRMVEADMKKTLLTALLIGGLLPIAAKAIPITLGSSQRTATLASAIDGATLNDVNPDAADVSAAFPALPAFDAANRGELTNAGTDDLLTITLDLGSTWGSGPASGTWAIAPSFWASYANAVISMHVGHGGGNPDAFMWLIEPNQTSGTWSYERLTGGGGGLSNMKLWSSGTGMNVPDGGATLALMGLVLMGLEAARRRVR